MYNHEIVLQDKIFRTCSVVKVKDTIYDPSKNTFSEQWFWIYAENSEFFPFDLWEKLDHAEINQIIQDERNFYKVIKVITKKRRRLI